MDLCIHRKKWLRQKWVEIIIKAGKQRCNKSRSLPLASISIVYERLISLTDRQLQVTNQVCGCFGKQ